MTNIIGMLGSSKNKRGVSVEELATRWGADKGKSEQSGRATQKGTQAPQFPGGLDAPEEQEAQHKGNSLDQPVKTGGDRLSLDQPAQAGNDWQDLDQPAKAGGDRSEGLDQPDSSGGDRPVNVEPDDTILSDIEEQLEHELQSPPVEDDDWKTVKQ